MEEGLEDRELGFEAVEVVAAEGGAMACILRREGRPRGKGGKAWGSSAARCHGRAYSWSMFQSLNELSLLTHPGNPK